MLIRGRWSITSGILDGGQPDEVAKAPELAIMRVPAGEMDERFKSHAWKACIGS